MLKWVRWESCAFEGRNKAIDIVWKNELKDFRFYI